jgi:hypothetical protein
MTFYARPRAGGKIFVRGSLMGFLFCRENRAEAIKVLVYNLNIDGQMATKQYDSSRLIMTADAALSEETQKRMIAFLPKSHRRRKCSASIGCRFSALRKAHIALQTRASLVNFAINYSWNNPLSGVRGISFSLTAG